MWKRPVGEYPRVWHTFQAANLEGSIATFEIKDLPLERFDEAVSLMKLYYLTDEPLAKVMKLLGEPDSIEDYIRLWKISMNQKMPIGCFDGDRLVGVNWLTVVTKNDPEKKKDYHGMAFTYTIEMYMWILKQHDMYENYGIDTYLIAYGMVVSRDYRQRGIATEFLKARLPIMKEFKIPYTATLFSSIGTQKAAANAGYDVYYEIEYDECIKMGYPIAGIEPKSAKLMGTGIKIIN